MSEPNDPPQRQIGVIIGVVLIGVGMWAGLSNIGAFTLPASVARAFDVLRTVRWPFAAIIFGVALVVLAGRPGFRLPSKTDRLYRSRTNKVVSGALGGIARYFGVDSTLLRLAYVGAALVFGWWTAVVVYAVIAFVMPVEPLESEVAGQVPPEPPAGGPPGENVG